MLVFYVFQGADGEDPQHPNALQISGNGPITPSDVAKKLPFRDSGNNSSHFHFRFKKAEGKTNASYVWQDIEYGGQIPPYNGTVWVKILRVPGTAPVSQAQTRARNPSPRIRNKKTNSPATVRKPSPKPTITRKKAPPKPTQRNTPTRAKATVGSWGNVLDTKPDAPPVDLGNIEDIRSRLPADFDEKSERVKRALVKRVRDELEKAKAAVAARKAAAAAAAARSAAKELVDKKVKDKVQSWHKDSTGQAKGLWTLLCNLDQALWQPNEWQQVDSSRMLETKYVKRMFRRGIKIVHPDRLPAGSTPEQEVAAQRITQALQEAWAVYSQKNNL